MILVTGGAGYIGSAFCRMLARDQIPHISLDNLSKGHRASLPDTMILEADLLDPTHVDQAFASHAIQAVVHFAGSIEVAESVRDPHRYWQNNLVGTLNLLQAMRRAHVRNIVFSSTAAVYGAPGTIPIPECAELRPQSPYGQTKLACEHMIRSFAGAYGWRFGILRYFNACGASPDGRHGEDHDPETHLIPRLLLAAGRNDPSVEIYGTDYDTPDGTCIRDYVHVDDLASAHQVAVTRIQDGGSSIIANLGTGRGHSVLDVVASVERITGSTLQRTTLPRRDGDPARLVADPSCALAELGWSAKYTSLEEIIRHAWAWHRSHPVGYGDRA